VSVSVCVVPLTVLRRNRREAAPISSQGAQFWHIPASLDPSARAAQES
jgi:hypothetical protein